jgi:gliding motility-associated-like protein
LLLPQYVRVARPTAAFQLSDSVGGCTPFTINFTNTSDYYQSSVWTFPGSTSTAANSSYTFTQPGDYSVKLAVTSPGGCVDSTRKRIRIYSESDFGLSYTPLEGCSPVLATATVNGPQGINYIWDFGDGTLVQTQNRQTEHLYTSIGSFVPRLILSDSGGNCLVPFTGTDTIRVKGVITHFGWDKQSFCDTGRVQFLDSTIFNDPIVSYQWNFGDGGTSAEQSPVHLYQNAGLYTVSLIAKTVSDCSDTTLFQNLVKVVQSPQIAINGIAAECKDIPVTHQGIFLRPDTSAVQWQWQFPNGSTAGSMQPPSEQYSTPGDFTVMAIATNSSGCTDTATKSLRVHPLPTISIPAQLTTRVGTAVPIQPASYATNVTSYLWSPPEGLSCTNCPEPIAKPKFNTTYTVLVTDSNGCRQSAQVQVIVLCQNANVFVPNTFSPNGDGSNDVFYVRGTGLARVKSLRIFNRLGEIVFERQNFGVNDPSTGWDGTFRGKQLSPDTYVYQLDVFCENSESVRFDGSLALIR